MANVIEQISVFLENRPGSLVEVLELLGAHGVNLRAYSVAETTDYGILRLIVHEPGAVEALLKSAGYPVRKTEVLGVLISDTPGASVESFRLLHAAGINVEYSYAFALAGSGQAVLLLRVDDCARAEEALSGAGIALARHTEIF